MNKLQKLEDKKRKRIKDKKLSSDARKRQLKLYKKTRKIGHKTLAAQKGREMRADQKAIDRLIKKIEKEKLRLKNNPPSGTGAWGGSKSIVQNEIMPIAREWGIYPTSGKRRETFGNPGSDHFIGNRTAFAKDFATSENGAFGAAIGRALGIGYSGLEDDYKGYYIERSGKKFRVQIICGTHGTGPHTHVGIRRV